MSFLQSVEWEKFQNAMGWRTWRLDGVLLIERPLRFGKKWLYSPRVTSPPTPLLQEERGASLARLAKQEGAIFVRLEPDSVDVVWLGDGWRKADHDIQPRETLILDLLKSEEELLAAMHKKTRYNIRLAERKGVVCKFVNDESGIKAFLKLSHDVKGRGDFQFHADEYYVKMREILGAAGKLEIGLAEIEGEVLAAHILIREGDTVTYAHGASSSSKRELMAPHLLQWESIERAKEAGAKYYDFYGISETKWPGVTRFKLSFGGERMEYAGAYDYVIDPMWYGLYNLGRKIL